MASTVRSCNSTLISGQSCFLQLPKKKNRHPEGAPSGCNALPSRSVHPGGRGGAGGSTPARTPRRGGGHSRQRGGRRVQAGGERLPSLYGRGPAGYPPPQSVQGYFRKWSCSLFPCVRKGPRQGSTARLAISAEVRSGLAEGSQGAAGLDFGCGRRRWRTGSEEVGGISPPRPGFCAASVLALGRGPPPGQLLHPSREPRLGKPVPGPHLCFLPGHSPSL